MFDCYFALYKSSLYSKFTLVASYNTNGKLIRVKNQCKNLDLREYHLPQICFKNFKLLKRHVELGMKFLYFMLSQLVFFSNTASIKGRLRSLNLYIRRQISRQLHTHTTYAGFSSADKACFCFKLQKFPKRTVAVR